MKSHPDRNRLRALDGVEPPDQWDDIVGRADADVPLLQLQPVRATHRLLVAAVLLVLAGVAGALVVSTATGDRGELEAVAADGGSTPAFPSGGDGAPGTAATTPDGLPVPTTAPGGSGSGSGSGSGTGSGSGGTGPGSGGAGTGTGSGSGSGAGRTTTTAPSGGTSTTVAPGGTTTTAPGTATTVTAPSEGAGGEVPTDPPPSPVWGKRWQVLLMAQGGVSRPMGTDRLISLDARTDGQLTLQVCSRTSATASIDGDRLVVALGVVPAPACGEPLDGHEAFLTAFLEDDPTFFVDGNRLVLTVGNRRVELTPY